MAFDGCDIFLTDGWIMVPLTLTIIDFLENLYFSFRFFQFARKNSLSNASTIWNILRISMAVSQSIVFNWKTSDVSLIIRAVIFIIISYAITFDVGNSDSIIRPVIPEASRSLEDGHERRNNDDVEIDENENSQNSNMENGQERRYNVQMLDKDGSVTKKSLTFNEFASVILGIYENNMFQKS